MKWMTPIAVAAFVTANASAQTPPTRTQEESTRAFIAHKQESQAARGGQDRGQGQSWADARNHEGARVAKPQTFVHSRYGDTEHP
jgi:hypothetical protein